MRPVNYNLEPNIDNPPDSAAVVQQEQFTPVLPVMKWSDESDVVRRVNNTKAGLGASAWSRDEAQARRIGGKIQCGNIWINTHAEIQPNVPFGGWKQSGFGIEWGVEGLKTYCGLQSVYVRLLEAPWATDEPWLQKDINLSF
ncbi:Aldehyde/histidinol dehydrogenase [Whalleya microplaca]|nr:Aldehyde/histidinol dehydrogenase [Whalleya microplaca]